MTALTGYDIRIYKFSAAFPPVLVNVRIDGLLDLSSGYEYEERIEEPGLSNRYSAPQLTFAGYDTLAGNEVITFLGTLAPNKFVGLAEHEVHIVRPFNPTPLRFAIIPESYKKNTRRRSWSFTAVGEYAWCAIADASGLYRRSTTGWKVALKQTIPRQLIVNKPFTVVCDIVAGDDVIIGETQFGAIPVRVTSVTTAIIPGVVNAFSLQFAADTSQLWAVGASVNVTDAPQHNLLLEDVVNGLLQSVAPPTIPGCGLNFQAQLLSQVGDPFRSGVNLTGLPTNITGLGPNGTRVIAGSETFAYKNDTPPLGSWAFFNSMALPPVDLTNSYFYSFIPYTATQECYGERFTEVGPYSDGHYDATYYAYCLTGTPQFGALPVTRVRMYVSCSAPVAGVYTWTQSLVVEQTVNGGLSWFGQSTFFSTSGTTSTNLVPFLNQGVQGITNALPNVESVPNITAECFGLTLVASGISAQVTALFIEMYNTGAAGTPMAFRLVKADTSQAVGPGILVQNNARGFLQSFITSSSLAVIYLFYLDQLDDGTGAQNTPQLYVYDGGIDFFLGPLTVQARPNYPRPWPAIFRPRTLKKNRGYSNDATVALSYFGSGSGILFHLFADSDLLTGPPPVFIGGDPALPPLTPIDPGLVPGGTPSTTSAGEGNLGVADLAVIPDVNMPQFNLALWPCIISTPSGIVWVSFVWDGVLDVVDLKGMSVGDALSELATLVNAFWYPMLSATAFRTRTLAPFAGSLGALDDVNSVGGAIEVLPVNPTSYQYVRVSNNKDRTIVGEAGNPAFAGTPNGLDLSLSFVLSKSLASAVATQLYNYWRVSRQTVSIPHLDDGRAFALGKTFTIPTIDPGGVYQITGIGRCLVSRMLKIEGIALS